MKAKIETFFLFITLALHAQVYANESQLEAVISSRYTKEISRFLKNWTDHPIHKTIHFECYETPDDPYYIGTKHTMIIHAQIEDIHKILKDFEHYPQIFAGLMKAEIRSSDKNKYLIYSEQEIPIPFVENEKNEMFYWYHEVSSEKIIYRYQLKKSNHLKFNDGGIILESLQPDSSEKAPVTLFTQFDFLNTDWSLARTFGSQVVWKNTLKGLYQSDLAIQLRAENPQWKTEKILEISKDEADKFSTDECLNSRHSKKPPFPNN